MTRRVWLVISVVSGLAILYGAVQLGRASVGWEGEVSGADEQLRLMRWQRHFDKSTILADIRATLRSVHEDDLVASEELDAWCWKTDIWLRDLTGIQEFTAEYWREEPEMVMQNSSLRELESEANRWKGEVRDFKRQCA